MSATTSLPLTPKDFASDQVVRWCPGCGDYSILAQMKKVLAGLNFPRERMAFISGIGCSSRFPYYINSYGFHTIHGRAPTFATGLKLARPDLQVWVMTGDGDGLSIGGNHLLHALRRNADIKIVLFNNEIYGLTKGQYSPTSRVGTRSKSTPTGSFENPLRPLSVAIASEATFVARTTDRDIEHLVATLNRAAAHKGAAFVEVYQDCVIFNPGVFEYATDKSIKSDNVLYLEHGRPMIFGKDRNKGIRLQGITPEVVKLSGGIGVDDLLIHDEKAEHPTLAYLLSQMAHDADDEMSFPEVMGVLRNVQRPVHHELVEKQIEDARKAPVRGGQAATLQDLLTGDETWVVN